MAYEEYRHPFVGLLGREAVCHVRVYRHGGQVVVVLCELPDNPGTSVTNAAEIIADEVWALEGRPPLDRYIVVEHYPPLPSAAVLQRRTLAGDFDRVMLPRGDQRLVMDAGIVRRRVFGEVERWQHLKLDELEALIGEPWTPVPIA